MRGMSYIIAHANSVNIPLASESIQCCVSSPPYYGLRDYGTARWVGGDPNCKHQYQKGGRDPMASSKQLSNQGTTFSQYEHQCKLCGALRLDDQIGLEPSPEAYVANLLTVFREVWRVLKDDGTLWLNLGDSYWGGKGQSSQAWSTENQDRDTLQKSYHQISGKGETRPTDGKHPIIKPKDLIGIPWMVAFALRADGWYLRSEIIWAKKNCMPESVKDRPTRSHEQIFLLSKSSKYYYDYKAIMTPTKGNEHDKRARVSRKRFPTDTVNGIRKTGYYPMANARDVWHISVKPYHEAHFATFPPDLIEPCILAGSKEGDTVLDPFNGSGTVGEVSLKHHRHYFGCELNRKYIQLSHERLSKVQLVMPGI